MGVEMRLVSFIFLSVSLHAAALVYPVSFDRRNPVELIKVTILPIKQAAGGANAQGGSGSPAATRDEQSPRATTAPTPKLSPKPSPHPQPNRSHVTTVASTIESNMAWISAIDDWADEVVPAISDPVDSDSNSTENSLGETGGARNFASSGTGSRSGGGYGGGVGVSGTGTVVTQARYRDTPRPDYPESARRRGQQGRVLLRVFIDAQGRSKQVKINSSSGSDALDHAATEAIKRWRFHPARSGGQPIESWVNVPIDFRLSEEKNSTGIERR